MKLHQIVPIIFLLGASSSTSFAGGSSDWFQVRSSMHYSTHSADSVWNSAQTEVVRAAKRMCLRAGWNGYRIHVSEGVGHWSEESCTWDAKQAPIARTKKMMKTHPPYYTIYWAECDAWVRCKG